MEITKKAFSFLLSILPVLLITGPAIPDIVITFSAIFFNNINFLEKILASNKKFEVVSSINYFLGFFDYFKFFCL